MTGPVRTSVLIPALNEERLLGATLASIHASFMALGRSDYEIVVCDNNSTDRTAEVARLGGARVVFEPHNSISRARNAAARAATGESFVFMDADVQTDVALLSATLARLESGTIGGGGALLRLDTDRPGWLGALMLWCWNLLSRLRKLAPGGYIYCLRRAWEGVGGFDESLYFLEDIWFSRALKGWCRRNGLGVSIISEARALDSTRKLRWFTRTQLLRHHLHLFVPGSIRRREAWPLLYRRPPGTPAGPEEEAVTRR